MDDLVSILVPCYNHEKFLNDLVDSIFAQSYHNIQVVIIDDYSTDNSWNLLQKLEKKIRKVFPKSIVMRNGENLGITKTINKMLDLAVGRYVKVIASDDILLCNAIEVYLKYANIYDNVSVFISNGMRVYEESSYNNIIAGKKIYEDYPDFSSSGFFERLYKHNFVFAPGMFVKRSIYEKYGRYDEKISIEDWPMWLHLSYNNVVFKYIDEVLVYYRQGRNSFSSMYGNDLERRRIRMFKSDISVIESFKGCVEQNIFCETKRQVMVNELKLARKYDLDNLYVIVFREILGSHMIKNIPLRERVFFLKKLLKNTFSRRK